MNCCKYSKWTNRRKKYELKPSLKLPNKHNPLWQCWKQSKILPGYYLFECIVLNPSSLKLKLIFVTESSESSDHKYKNICSTMLWSSSHCLYKALAEMKELIKHKENLKFSWIMFQATALPVISILLSLQSLAFQNLKHSLVVFQRFNTSINISNLLDWYSLTSFALQELSSFKSDNVTHLI